MREKRFKKISDNEYIDQNTGEILTPQEAMRQLQLENEIAINTQSLVKSEIKILEDQLGIERLADTHQFQWKKGYEFTKIIRSEKISHDINLTLYERAFLHLIIDLLEWGTNRIIVDNKDITNKFIEDELDISKPTVMKILNSLEDKNIIKRVGERRARQIFLNPNYACMGNIMLKKTIKLFNI